MELSYLSPLLRPDLEEMLDRGDAVGVRAFFDELHPAITAELLGDLPPADVWKALKTVGPQLQAETFSYFDLHSQEALFDLKERDGGLGRDGLSRLIEAMNSDDRADLLSRLEPKKVDALLPLVKKAERADIRRLLSYPDDSAGSVMSTEYASLSPDLSVAEAIARLRLLAPSRETIYYVYVVDEDRRLLGFISLRDLILDDPDARLGDVMNRGVISVRVTDDREEVARDLTRYDFIALPVVDEQNRLVGIVTYDDAADVLEEEATQDAQRQAAVEPLEDGYLQTPLWELAWKRGIWLVILLFAAFLTAGVLKMYEGGGAGGWMVMFIPLVLASGGNAGSQSATLVIRTLAIEDSTGRDEPLAGRITLKELTVGSALGLSLAGLSFAVAGTLVDETGKAVTVALTVLMVVMIGTVLGALLPLGFRRLGVDPALMSNPLIAAVVDVLGVVIYYQTARAIVG